MQTEGSFGILTEKCVEFATNAYKFEQIYQQGEWDQDFFEIHQDYPEIFCLPHLPSYWSFNETVDISIFIDVDMHILYLGFMKAIAYIIKLCMKNKHKTQFFLFMLNPKLKDLINLHSSNLPWNESDSTDISFGNYIS